jgi:hypothetical protein
MQISRKSIFLSKQKRTKLPSRQARLDSATSAPSWVMQRKRQSYRYRYSAREFLHAKYFVSTKIIVLGSSSNGSAKEVYKYCKVTSSTGEDITDQLFVEDAKIPFVDCSGATTRCQGVNINNCEKVVCSGTEACSHA